MRSTFGGLNTMVRGINSSQLSLDTIGHNITNANTEGYSRQRANLATTRSQTVYGFYGACQLGTGVDATSITRARDSFADKQYWKENSSTENAMAKKNAYNQIEAIFDEGDNQGFQSVLSKFWSAWKTLGDSASDGPSRGVVRDTGNQLTGMMQKQTKQLQALITDYNDQTEIKVDSINQLTSQISDLNKQIFTSEASGGFANDLRDSRDLMVDKLSALVNVSVQEQADGNYSISSGGNILVDGNTSLMLSTRRSVNAKYGVQDIEVIVDKSGTTFKPENGELRGLLDSTAKSKEFIGQMGMMSAFLMTTFNTAHRNGYGMNDETKHNFFGEDDLTYSYNTTEQELYVDDGTTVKKMNTVDIINQLDINSKFYEKNGTDLIAAKTDPKAQIAGGNTGEDTASGANAILLGELLHVHSSSPTLGEVTLASYYTGMMGSLGIEALGVDRAVTNQENIMGQIDNWRGGVSGVNWDEELTDMIKFQTAYKSASRCLTAMDEMLDKLINSTGVVGR